MQPRISARFTGKKTTIETPTEDTIDTTDILPSTTTMEERRDDVPTWLELI